MAKIARGLRPRIFGTSLVVNLQPMLAERHKRFDKGGDHRRACLKFRRGRNLELGTFIATVALGSPLVRATSNKLQPRGSHGPGFFLLLFSSPRTRLRESDASSAIGPTLSKLRTRCQKSRASLTRNKGPRQSACFHPATGRKYGCPARAFFVGRANEKPRFCGGAFHTHTGYADRRQGEGRSEPPIVNLTRAAVFRSSLRRPKLTANKVFEFRQAVSSVLRSDRMSKTPDKYAARPPWKHSEAMCAESFARCKT
jgi:hypothetical protein